MTSETEKNTASAGIVYIVSTPIGNLNDLTIRGLETLKAADIIAAEDTRQTRKLLSHFEITGKKLVSMHIHNEHGKVPALLKQAQEGLSIAVVSDAGTPCIADPGFLIVREAVKLGVRIKVIPGVSSVTFAAAAAALPIDKFVFDGFIPVKSGRKTRLLEAVCNDDLTHIMFESPHRIEKTLKMLKELGGGGLAIAVVREATKIYEEVLRGTVDELLCRCEGKKWKGEIVLVVSPQTKL